MTGASRPIGLAQPRQHLALGVLVILRHHGAVEMQQGAVDRTLRARRADQRVAQLAKAARVTMPDGGTRRDRMESRIQPNFRRPRGCRPSPSACRDRRRESRCEEESRWRGTPHVGRDAAPPLSDTEAISNERPAKKGPTIGEACSHRPLSCTRPTVQRASPTTWRRSAPNGFFPRQRDSRRLSRHALGDGRQPRGRREIRLILIHPISASANPSGIVTRAAFDELCDTLIGAARAQGPIDGALLHFHGAMVAEDHEDAEGEMLARLRQAIGPRSAGHRHPRPPRQRHARDDRASSALIAFRTYRIIDQYERACRAPSCSSAPWPARSSAHGDRAAADDLRLQSRPHADRAMSRRSPAPKDRKSGEALVVSICAGFTAAKYTRCRAERDGDRRRRRSAPAGDRRGAEWISPGRPRDYDSATLLPIADGGARPAGQAGRQAAGRRRLHRTIPAAAAMADATAFLKGLIEADVKRRRLSRHLRSRSGARGIERTGSASSA